MMKWIARLLRKCVYQAEMYDKAIEAQRKFYEEVMGEKNDESISSLYGK